MFGTILLAHDPNDSLGNAQGSLQAGVKAERMGVVWAEFVTTSIDYFPTSKLN